MNTLGETATKYSVPRKLIGVYCARPQCNALEKFEGKSLPTQIRLLLPKIRLSVELSAATIAVIALYCRRRSTFWVWAYWKGELNREWGL